MPWKPSRLLLPTPPRARAPSGPSLKRKAKRALSSARLTAASSTQQRWPRVCNDRFASSPVGPSPFAALHATSLRSHQRLSQSSRARRFQQHQELPRTCFCIPADRPVFLSERHNRSSRARVRVRLEVRAQGIRILNTISGLLFHQASAIGLPLSLPSAHEECTEAMQRLIACAPSNPA